MGWHGSQDPRDAPRKGTQRRSEEKRKMLRTRRLVPLRGSVGIRRRTSDSASSKGVDGQPRGRSPATRGRWITRRTWVRSIPVWVRFDQSQGRYQRVENYEGLRPRGATRSRGVDGISRCFVRLTTRRTPLCRLASMQGIQKQQREYYAAFVAMEGRILGVFLVTDILWFYVRFEAVLIPMYRRIGVWGSRARKIRAAYFFMRYTLVGSVRMLLGILYLNSRYGTTDLVSLKYWCSAGESLGGLEASTQRRRWRAFFASLAVKVPMVPVHIWLPEAHVEAPTGGSVILAGVLLKLGTYGMMRRLRGRFPMATVYFTPRVYRRAVVAIVYTSRTAIRQTDRKRIVAYASVAHMNMTLVGLFSRTEQGVEGALFQMLSHGLVAGALFMVIGVLYDRYHTRRVMYYGGLAQTMPRFAFVFLFFTMANIALPGTSSFVGERMILLGIIQTNTIVTARSATGMVLGGAYSLWLYNRVAYGNLKTMYIGEHMSDLDRREGRMFAPLRGRTRFLGRYPSCILDTIHTSCVSRVEHVRRCS
jgi:NADH-quinone oxidoreductase subunit M